MDFQGFQQFLFRAKVPLVFVNAFQNPFAPLHDSPIPGYFLPPFGNGTGGTGRGQRVHDFRQPRVCRLITVQVVGIVRKIANLRVDVVRGRRFAFSLSDEDRPHERFPVNLENLLPDFFAIRIGQQVRLRVAQLELVICLLVLENARNLIFFAVDFKYQLPAENTALPRLVPLALIFQEAPFTFPPKPIKHGPHERRERAFPPAVLLTDDIYPVMEFPGAVMEFPKIFNMARYQSHGYCTSSPAIACNP